MDDLSDIITGTAEKKVFRPQRVHTTVVNIITGDSRKNWAI